MKVLQQVRRIKQSKCGCCLELHHFYRSLDLLAEHKESIELELFNRTQTYFDLKVDMIFWDTTSTCPCPRSGRTDCQNDLEHKF